MVNFSKRQWLTLIVIGIADFFNAICVSLQAPFYPQEAERKGASATEYGLVFGIFELVVFIVSPLYGRHINKLGPKLMFNGGIYTTGICAILFGLLDKVEGHYPFIILSFIIRIIEAMGNASFLTASFAIIAKEFPDNVATTFACLETCFGLGLIVGPTVGGLLYEVGGYTTPFAVLGGALFCSAILTNLVLPKQNEGRDEDSGPSIFRVLKIPGVLLSTASIMVTSMSIGFLQATLEPHLRQFGLSPVILGIMFVINGGTYALMAPIWGWLCDNFVHPKFITFTGTLLVATAFALVGPAPFIKQHTVLWVTVLGLVIHGLGIGAQLVASFSDALRTSITHGFQNNLETHGLISGLWTSSFAFGAFIGPSVSGILFDSVGFRNATMFIFGLHLLVGLFVAMFIIFGKRPREYVEIKDADKMSNGDIASSVRSAVTSIAESTRSIRSIGNGISIERSRPAGMNSLIACNSYKSQAWPKKEANGVTVSAYSYGAVRDNRNGNTPFLHGVA
ncbi:MFS-type transporter SLC18B1-like [Onthophagus taurus]|uniref:MFS-type transporter SLC18B1-like n=1 Tax=Onthophagus taurus TaxID=166361 RepID=UPI000C2087AA|nr:MFS-type transporter SLC18B1-like [Onthophagus taurus]